MIYRNTEILLASCWECSSSRDWKENDLAVIEKDPLFESTTDLMSFTQASPLTWLLQNTVFSSSEWWYLRLNPSAEIFFQIIGRYICTLEMGSVHFNSCSLSLHTANNTIFITFFLTGPFLFLFLFIDWLRLMVKRKYHEIRLYLVEVTADPPVRLMLMVVNPWI